MKKHQWSRCWMCGWSSKNAHPSYLKTHITKSGHKWGKEHSHRQARQDIKRDKLEALQQHYPQVMWGIKEVRKCWVFEYLGSIFHPSGAHMTDVRRRIDMAKSRSGKLRHILQSKELELDLRIRLYVATCCPVLAYWSEVWRLDDETCRAINAVNAFMLSHITGKS